MGAYENPHTTFVSGNHHLSPIHGFRIYPNYPNPFNASTCFRYALPEPSPVKISIFNVQGQLVETLVDADLEAGEHEIHWHARDLSSGVYFCRIVAGERRAVGKCLLVK
jgi:hypothetical protein